MQVAARFQTGAGKQVGFTGFSSVVGKNEAQLGGRDELVGKNPFYKILVQCRKAGQEGRIQPVAVKA